MVRTDTFIQSSTWLDSSSRGGVTPDTADNCDTICDAFEGPKALNTN